MLINTSMIQFNNITNGMGELVAIENQRNIPFDIKRIYYITNVPCDVVRGNHSHCDLQQVLICLNGSVNIKVKTPKEEEIIFLDHPSKGLFIGNNIWREMFDFSPGAVLLVLADKLYSENDYIRSYEDYLKITEDFFKD